MSSLKMLPVREQLAALKLVDAQCTATARFEDEWPVIVSPGAKDTRLDEAIHKVYMNSNLMVDVTELEHDAVKDRIKELEEYLLREPRLVELKNKCSNLAGTIGHIQKRVAEEIASNGTRKWDAFEELEAGANAVLDSCKKLKTCHSRKAGEESQQIEQVVLDGKR